MIEKAHIQEFKQRVVTDFNSRTQYDNDWRHNLANRLIELAELQSGQRILDVATGTGIVAIAAAQIVGSEGQVIGVDISSGMLSQAQQKVAAVGLKNIELLETDAEELKFGADSFDAILCSSAIVYLTDIPAALHNWYRFLKPGGIVAFSCFAETAHTLSVLFRAVAKRYGIDIPNPNEPLGTTERCYDLLQAVGFKQIQVVKEQFGFHTNDVEAAWNGNANSAFGFQVFQLKLSQLKQCKAEYFAAVEALATAPETWNDVTTFFVIGKKPVEI